MWIHAALFALIGETDAGRTAGKTDAGKAAEKVGAGKAAENTDEGKAIAGETGVGEAQSERLVQGEQPERCWQKMRKMQRMQQSSAA